MKRNKRKLTSAQRLAKKAAKAERRSKYHWVFMGGRQVRVKQPATVDGIPLDKFIEENADPIWLHQNELWEFLPVEESAQDPDPSNEPAISTQESEIPF